MILEGDGGLPLGTHLEDVGWSPPCDGAVDGEGLPGAGFERRHRRNCVLREPAIFLFKGDFPESAQEVEIAGRRYSQRLFAGRRLGAGCLALGTHGAEVSQDWPSLEI